MPFKTISEGKAKIRIPTETKISKKLPVFYNPVMMLNRDVSIILLNAVDDSKIRIADPLAGTGIRAIRFLAELDKDKLDEIVVNDSNPDFVNHVKKNLELSGLRGLRGLSAGSRKLPITFSNDDANLFLLNSTGFDYIDVDPFGTPNPFLDSAIRRLSREGILAVTATDTSALCGAFTNACRRKYWATPGKGPMMHETGLRILVRKVQLIGAQYERALTPIFSYSKDHYMRVFFRCRKAKTEVDKVIKQHGMLGDSGPMWLGTLGDAKLAKGMVKRVMDLKAGFGKEVTEFLQVVHGEMEIGTVGFHDIHALSKKLKLKWVPKTDDIIKAIEEKKFKVAKTHFSKYGLRSSISEKDLINILQGLQP